MISNGTEALEVFSVAKGKYISGFWAHDGVVSINLGHGERIVEQCEVQQFGHLPFHVEEVTIDDDETITLSGNNDPFGGFMLNSKSEMKIKWK